MIVNETEYNPLRDILDILPVEFVPMEKEILNSINKLLFSAGVVAENEKDVSILINTLVKVGIIVVKFDKDGNGFIKRGYN
jgi:hypothetical protein